MQPQKHLSDCSHTTHVPDDKSFWRGSSREPIFWLLSMHVNYTCCTNSFNRRARMDLTEAAQNVPEAAPPQPQPLPPLWPKPARQPRRQPGSRTAGLRAAAELPK